MHAPQQRRIAIGGRPRGFEIGDELLRRVGVAGFLLELRRIDGRFVGGDQVRHLCRELAEIFADRAAAMVDEPVRGRERVRIVAGRAIRAQQRDALKSKVDGRVGLAFFLLST